jgi:hypothetical protein
MIRSARPTPAEVPLADQSFIGRPIVCRYAELYVHVAARSG